jgi:hypothetical protein
MTFRSFISLLGGVTLSAASLCALPAQAQVDSISHRSCELMLPRTLTEAPSDSTFAQNDFWLRAIFTQMLTEQGYTPRFPPGDPKSFSQLREGDLAATVISLEEAPGCACVAKIQVAVMDANGAPKETLFTGTAGSREGWKRFTSHPTYCEYGTLIALCNQAIERLEASIPVCEKR